MLAPSEVAVAPDARFATRKAFTSLDVAVSVGVTGARLQIESACEELLEALEAQQGSLRFYVGPNYISLGGQVAHLCSGQAGNLAGRLFAAGIRQFRLEQGAERAQLEALTEVWIRMEGAALAAALHTAPTGHFIRVDPWFEQQRRGARSFLGPFRAILGELVPGVVGSPPPEHHFRDTELLPRSVSRAEGSIAEATSDAEAAFGELRATVAEGWPAKRSAEHLMDLLCRVAMRRGHPLDAATMAELLASSGGLLLDAGEWSAHAAAVRGLRGLAEAAAERPGREAVAALFMDAAVGPSGARAVARHLGAAPEEYIRWARWYFFEAGHLTHDAMLEAFVGVPEGPGRQFLRDLMGWQGQPKPDWWLGLLDDDRPDVVTEALIALQRVELSARQRERMGSALLHPRPQTRLLALRLIGSAMTNGMREQFVTLLLDDDQSVRQAMLARLIHLDDPRGANAIVAAIRSTRFVELPEHEQRRLFVGLAGLGGDRFIRAFRDILKLDEVGRGIGRLFRRETIADDPLRRAAVHGLAVLGTPDAIASLEVVAKRGVRTLSMLAEQLLEAATSGQLRREELVSEAPSALLPLSPKPEGRPEGEPMGAERLFEPSAFGLSPSSSLEMLLRGYLGAAEASTEAPAEGPAPDAPSPPDTEPAPEVAAAPDTAGEPDLPPLPETPPPEGISLPTAETAGSADAVGADDLAVSATEGPGEAPGVLDQLGQWLPEDVAGAADTVSPLDALMGGLGPDEDEALPEFARSTLPLEPIQLARGGEPIDLESSAFAQPLQGPALDGSEAFPAEETGAGQTPAPLGPPADVREADGLFGPAGSTVGPPQPTPVPEFGGGGVAPELSMLLDDLGPPTPPPLGGLLALAAVDAPDEPVLRGAETPAGLAAAGGRMAATPPRDGQDLSAGPPPLKAAFDTSEDRLPDVQTNAPDGGAEGKAVASVALESLLGSLFEEEQ